MKKILLLLVAVTLLLGGCSSQEVKDEVKEEISDVKEDIKDAIPPSGETGSSPSDKGIDESQFVGEEKAKETALKQAGLKADDVVFEMVRLEKDDGVWVYEVDFRQGRTEYDAEISATDGTILSWDVDND